MFFRGNLSGSFVVQPSFEGDEPFAPLSTVTPLIFG